MSISQQRRDLFRHADALDKLSLLQTLLDSRDLNSDTAFALLNAVHAELRQPRRHDSRAYIRYGDVMGSLHRGMPEVYNGVIAQWETSRLGISKQVSSEMPQEPVDEDFNSHEKEILVSHSLETVQSVVKMPQNTADGETVEIGGGREEELEVPEAEEDEEKEESEEKEGEEERTEFEEEEEPEKEEGEERELEENEEDEEKEEKQETEEEEESGEEETEEKEQEKEDAEEEPQEEEKEESEETETEEAEEKQEEPQVEKGETESEGTHTDNAEEADQMATEAAEAAEHMEEQEAEPEAFEEESGTEEEPPMQAAE